MLASASPSQIYLFTNLFAFLPCRRTRRRLLTGLLRGAGRIECFYWRQWAVEALDLHRRELPDAALRQFRGAGVARQDIGVAMHTERVVGGRILGVVPSAGRELDDTGTRRLAQYGAGQARAAIVVEAHGVAITNAARRRILRMDAHRLAVFDLRLLARHAEIQLTVQAGGRLIGNQLQRKTSVWGVEARQPSRVSRTVRVTEPRNLRGADLDLAARRRQRRDGGIPAECPHGAALPGLGRQHNFARLPEFIEIGGHHTTLQQGSAGWLVKVAQPLAHRAAFGERLGDAEALAERRKDRVVV